MISRQVSYFIIAFSIYLIGRAAFYFLSEPVTNTLFDLFLGLSLLCSNLPRVLYLPPRIIYRLMQLDFVFLGLAVFMFILIFFV